MKRLLTTVGAAAMLLAPLAASADAYQYIVAGYPAANESYAAASSGMAFVTATRAVPTAAQALEARYRTWDESDGIPFRSDRFQAMMIIFR